MTDYQSIGFEVHTGVFSEKELPALRFEADRLQAEFGKACIRRIRTKSTVYHNLPNDPRLSRLIPTGLMPVRSILFDKRPEENWPVAWHQDLTIAVRDRVDINGFGPWSIKDGVHHVQPPIEFLQSVTTLRIHLDDTPASNGALRVIPGSHSLGRLEAPQIRELTAADSHLVDCLAGDVLRMSPLILHASSRAKAPSRRRILHFEFAHPSKLPDELGFLES